MNQDTKYNVQMLIDKLVEHFGITQFSKDGGYILPDGRLLDLQRSDTKNHQYHRSIAELVPKSMHGLCDEITIVNLLSATGAIRYENKGRVHVAAPPTEAQRRKLFSLMKYSVNPYRVMVSDINGATIGEATFQSPQAHELLDFFSGCFSSTKKTYRKDEFYVTKEDNDYILIFRTNNRKIGRYSSLTSEYQIEPNFSDAMDLFKEKLLELQVNKGE
jgi:hypothetical protein